LQTSDACEKNKEGKDSKIQKGKFVFRRRRANVWGKKRQGKTVGEAKGKGIVVIGPPD